MTKMFEGKAAYDLGIHFGYYPNSSWRLFRVWAFNQHNHNSHTFIGVSFWKLAFNVTGGTFKVTGGV